MAQKDRSTLKSFFETGDIPTEGNYTDLIDSSLSLAEGNTGNINLTGEITASGNISSSGTLTAESLSITNVVTTHVTASSISSSGDLIASRILVNEGNGIFFDDSFGDGADPDFPQKIIGQDNLIQVQADNFFNVLADETRFITQSGTTQITFNHITGDITASGGISSSGNVTAANMVTVGRHYFDGFAGSNPFIQHGDGDLIIQNAGIHATGNITASGDISSSGTLIGNSLNLGGTAITATATEINKLDGATVTTTEINRLDGVTATNATHLKTMDQSVATNSTVTFAGITLSKVSKGGIGNYGDIISADGQSTTFQMSNIPIIPGKADSKIGKSAPTFVRNTNVTQTSTIIVTCLTDQLSVTAFGNATATAIANAGYFISLGNESTDTFAIGSASFSALVF